LQRVLTDALDRLEQETIWFVGSNCGGSCLSGLVEGASDATGMEGQQPPPPPPPPRRGRRVAVVGSGIAGMSAAYHLAKHGTDLQVHLFEADARLGGHEMPLETRFGTIDLGFMVRTCFGAVAFSQRSAGRCLPWPLPSTAHHWSRTNALPAPGFAPYPRSPDPTARLAPSRF
jgi:hypothetical protein